MAATVKTLPISDEKPTVESEKLDDGSRRQKLIKPVRALDKTLEELVFREPTARDIYELGTPVEVVNGKLEFDARLGTEMMARLAGVPLGTITNQMSAKDWTNCKLAILPFFLPELPTETTS